MNNIKILSIVTLLLLAFAFSYNSISDELLNEQPDGQSSLIGTQVSSSSTTIGHYDTNTSHNWVSINVIKIEQFLTNKDYSSAIHLIDDIYQQANANEFDSFKTIILEHSEKLLSAGDVQNAKILLEYFTQSFNEADAWSQLASTQISLEEWNNAVTSLLKSSAIEYRPDQLELTLQKLIKASNYARADLERKGDELGILQLYQTIYKHHPDYARFQLELAQSYLRLGDPKSARPLLEVLQYDHSLGELAIQKLEKLNRQEQRKFNEDYNSANLISLIPAANSFLIDVLINSQSIRLLVDTGASITGISSELISKLGLTTTGKIIQLNTVNGVIHSELYLANYLQIGQYEFNDIVVAKINLQQSNGFHGLLGTDILSQLGSYKIDNEKNALIIK